MAADLDTQQPVANLDIQFVAHLVFVILLQAVSAEPGQSGLLVLEDIELELELALLEAHAKHLKANSAGTVRQALI